MQALYRFWVVCLLARLVQLAPVIVAELLGGNRACDDQPSTCLIQIDRQVSLRVTTPTFLLNIFRRRHEFQPRRFKEVSSQ